MFECAEAALWEKTVSNKKQGPIGFGAKTMTEKELVKRFQAGDERTFDILVTQYHSRLIQVASVILGDADEAEDMVQETFVKAYFKHKSFRGDSSLYTWLYRILHNLCITALRKRKSKNIVSFDSNDEDSFDLPSNEPNPYDESEKKDIREAVNEAMMELPDQQRTIFAMKQIDGMKHHEIASILGITEGAVKASYFHAVQKLKGLLQQYRGDYELQ